MKIQPLSTLYKQCKLPNVTKDIFGDVLEMGNVSDVFIKEHPVLITDYNKNFKRPKPIEECLSWLKVDNYLKQFKDMQANFDSQNYVTKAYEAFHKVLGW